MLEAQLVAALLAFMIFGQAAWLRSAPETPETDATSIVELFQNIEAGGERAERLSFRLSPVNSYSMAPDRSALEIVLAHRDFSLQHTCAPLVVSATGPHRPLNALGWRLASINGNPVTGELNEEAAVDACYKDADFKFNFIGGMSKVRFERTSP
jgi:hypothetical protein